MWVIKQTKIMIKIKIKKLKKGKREREREKKGTKFQIFLIADWMSQYLLKRLLIKAESESYFISIYSCVKWRQTWRTVWQYEGAK